MTHRCACLEAAGRPSCCRGASVLVRSSGTASAVTATRVSAPASTSGVPSDVTAAIDPAAAAPMGISPQATTRYAPDTRPIAVAGVSRCRRAAESTFHNPIPIPISAFPDQAAVAVGTRPINAIPTPLMPMPATMTGPSPQRRLARGAIQVPSRVPEASTTSSVETSTGPIERTSTA